MSQQNNDASSKSNEKPLDKRLAELSRCTDEMEWCRNHEGTVIDLVGELDWLSELHFQLYDDFQQRFSSHEAASRKSDQDAEGKL